MQTKLGTNLPKIKCKPPVISSSFVSWEYLLERYNLGRATGGEALYGIIKEFLLQLSLQKHFKDVSAIYACDTKESHYRDLLSKRGLLLEFLKDNELPDYSYAVIWRGMLVVIELGAIPNYRGCVSFVSFDGDLQGAPDLFAKFLQLLNLRVGSVMPEAGKVT